MLSKGACKATRNAPGNISDHNFSTTAVAKALPPPNARSKVEDVVCGAAKGNGAGRPLHAAVPAKAVLGAAAHEPGQDRRRAAQFAGEHDLGAQLRQLVIHQVEVRDFIRQKGPVPGVTVLLLALLARLVLGQVDLREEGVRVAWGEIGRRNGCKG